MIAIREDDRDFIQEAHPQKQGLKLFVFASYNTRLRFDSRSTSTKTRIETFFVLPEVQRVPFIQEAHPQKQGLKLKQAILAVFILAVFKKHIHKNKD